jgi:hypothetical protein
MAQDIGHRFMTKPTTGKLLKSSILGVCERLVIVHCHPRTVFFEGLGQEKLDFQVSCREVHGLESALKRVPRFEEFADSHTFRYRGLRDCQLACMFT